MSLRNCIRFFSIVLSIALALITTAARRADACSYRPAGWEVPEPPAEMEVGYESSLGFRAHFTEGRELTVDDAMAFIEVQVTDLEGNPVDGSAHYEEAYDFLIWTPSEPLAPNAEYNATIKYDVLADDSSPALTETATHIVTTDDRGVGIWYHGVWLQLTDWMRPNEVCCPSSLCQADTCGGEAVCEQCWSDSAEAMPNLVFTWSYDAPQPEYQPLGYELQIGASEESLQTALQFGSHSDLDDQGVYGGIEFPQDSVQEAYCARLIIHDLSTGEEMVSDVACINHDELEPSAIMPEFEEPDTSTCTGPARPTTDSPFDTDVESDEEGTDPPGCNQAGGEPSALAVLLAGLGLLIVAGRRRHSA